MRNPGPVTIRKSSRAYACLACPLLAVQIGCAGRSAGRSAPHGHQKGSEWKASYHNVRAAVFTSDSMKQASSSSPGPGR